MSAYQDGREAYFRGDRDYHNPHDQADDQYDLWRDGYDDAMAEECFQEANMDFALDIHNLAMLIVFILSAHGVAAVVTSAILFLFLHNAGKW